MRLEKEITKDEVAAAMRVVRRLAEADAIETYRFVQEVSEEVLGWIEDLKAKYPSVDIESVRQIYGGQLSSDETVLERSAVEDVFIGVKLGVYEPDRTP